MATYAVAADLETYMPTGSGLSGADAEKLLQRSERDVDYVAGNWPLASQTTGLKFDPTTLADWQKSALNRATCAQAEYRITMGEDFMVKAQYASVQGPDFTVSGRLPFIGPKVIRELVSGGLLRGGGGYATVPYGSCASGGDVIGNL
jgi:hypothetical protein